MSDVSKVTQRKGKSNEKPVEKPHENNKEEKGDEKIVPKFGLLPRFPHQRVWSRLVLVIGIMIYVYYYSTKVKVVTFARQGEILEQRGHNFQCDVDFEEDLVNFPECTPGACGRFVSDKIVTSTEAEILLKLAKKGLELGGSDGGASVLDLHSGALSYGRKFINVYSLEKSDEVFTAPDLTVYKIVKEKIKYAIAQLFDLHPDFIYLTHPTFFSRLTNAEPKTEHDEYWHTHIDKDTYESFHYTSLLYLNDYNYDFRGGRFVFVDGPFEKRTNVTVEPRKGRVSMFTSGAENTHFVERVESGTRYAVTISFTCDITKSIEDPVIPD
ncbi:2-oxoglutarate and iron-dependent oxygenase domain-containing protein 3-like [Onthophagus taurus]|uniref:2-oxoglutarate and iron-dependent oxygenase domain-containing protein 3-like n=1 Tax=Onthophagus taurus TaxID=166361 RepID=UPI0039BECA2D